MIIEIYQQSAQMKIKDFLKNVVNTDKILTYYFHSVIIVIFLILKVYNYHGTVAVVLFIIIISHIQLNNNKNQ